METSQFYSYLSKYPKVLNLLSGIFSIDNFPRTLKVNHFIICNSDVTGGRGLHWFVLYRVSKNLIECFDSLGFPDQNKKDRLISACRFNNISAVRVNSTPVQLNTTDTCGKFCLMFIMERLHNPDLTFDELLNFIFSDNCSRNEHLLKNFFEEVFESD